MAPRPTGPYVSDVAQERRAGLLRERIRLDVVTLDPPNANHLVLPVDVFELQPGHFAQPESVGRKQEQGSGAPNVDGAIGREARQDRFHVTPGGTRGQRFQVVEPRAGDGGGDTRATLPGAFGAAKKRAERLDRHGDRPPAPRGAAFRGQEVVDILNRHVGERTPLRPVPGEKGLGLPAVGSDRRRRQPPLVAHVGGEGIEEALEWQGRDGRRLRQPAPPSEPLFRPIPKVARGLHDRFATASRMLRGPTKRDGLDARHVQRIRTRQIERSRDHHQLAGDGVERAAPVSDVLQMAKELTAFFCVGTLPLAGQRDRAGEQFFKHGRTPFLGNPPILLLLLMWPCRNAPPPRIKPIRTRHHITAAAT